ncbi:hypothetical protein N7463_007472 [Penicillium fimorum]|uniref:Uncharacterized protein n=1 Tax=Penicillium fimorum TaxID=1882269 RepID=A0A9W9XWE4_9EURO|nr:hypothetical protein N7463_007472 [Penicillium fimorum]
MARQREIGPESADVDDGVDANKVDKVDADDFDAEEVNISSEDVSAEEVDDDDDEGTLVHELPTLNPLSNVHPA